MPLYLDHLLQVVNKVLTRTNAQTVQHELGELEEQRPRYRARWLWELIQNALDAARADREMAIVVSLADGVLKFRHNGRAFTEEEIVTLIYHGSTKPDAHYETAQLPLGKFGTGFLSSH